MEPSIDFSYIRRISYMDDLLLKEMLQSWELDVKERLTNMEQTIFMDNTQNYYKIVHEIKTSFLIIGSGKGLKYCEVLIFNLSNGGTITQQDVLNLKIIYKEIVEIISNQSYNQNLL